MTRPEHIAPPEIFYQKEEAEKYAHNSRMLDIQSELSERALELLALSDDSPPLFLLDIGCGSGISGDVISEHGHYWMGIDISTSMLDIAQEREVEGDLIASDLGDGVPFRPNVFDGAISISAIQWLCNADKSSHFPLRRLKKFFETLFASMKRSAKVVLQFYPESSAQIDMITTASLKAGFTGGLVVDFPHSTRAKKYFLVLYAGRAPPGSRQPEAKMETEDTAAFVEERYTKKRKRKYRDNIPVRGRQWIMEKKETLRKKGREVRPDSKYTGRKRTHKF